MKTRAGRLRGTIREVGDRCGDTSGTAISFEEASTESDSSAGWAPVGTRPNLEVDFIAKYVERLMLQK